MKGINLIVSLAAVAALVFAGCGKKEEDVATSPHDTGEIPLEQKYAMPGPADVNLSEEVRATWTAIKVEINDLESGKKETLVIDVGGEQAIAGSNLKVKAVSFLPAFQMDGANITSRSNELENPAAQIEVYEGDKQLFKGWLFTLYPTTHAFTHPKYSLTLLEGMKGEAKKKAAKKKKKG